MRALFALPVAVALGLASRPAEAGPPRYYLVVEPLQGARDVPPPLVEKLFLDELARHGEFAPPSPTLPKEPKLLAAKLAEQKLRGYVVTLKILESERTLVPGSPGKRPQLQRRVKLTLVGATIPEQLVAFGGDGESTAGTEVGKTVKPSDEEGLLSDALKDAITQAVTTAVTKLNAAGRPEPSRSHRKK